MSDPMTPRTTAGRALADDCPSCAPAILAIEAEAAALALGEAGHPDVHVGLRDAIAALEDADIQTLREVLARRPDLARRLTTAIERAALRGESDG